MTPSKPFADKKIVVTRARADAGRLAEMLEAQGATVIAFPTIETRAVDGPPDIGTLDRYDWILFTSRNAVDYFFEALPKLGVAAEFGDVRVAAIGPGTKERLHSRHIDVDLMPEDHIAEGLLDALESADETLDRRRILIPRGDLARDLLPDRLRALGADVSVATFYETVMPKVSEDVIDALIAARPDAAIFTSGSTVRNFARILGEENVLLLVRIGTVFVSIGPQTTDAALDSGIPVGMTAAHHDLEGVVGVLTRNFVQKRRT